MKVLPMLLISLLLASGSASDAASIAAGDDGHVAAARPPVDVAMRRSLATELSRRGEIAGRRAAARQRSRPCWWKSRS